MGLLRFAGDVWNQAGEAVSGGIRQAANGIGAAVQKHTNPIEMAKDVASDIIDPIIPGDLDKFAKSKTRVEGYGAGAPIKAEGQQATTRVINNVREPLVQELTGVIGKTVAERALKKKQMGLALGPAAAPVLIADTVNDVGAIGDVVSQVVTKEPLEHHGLSSARAFDEGRTIGDVIEAGEWNTEMPRRVEEAKKAFDPFKGDFGVTEIMFGR